MTAAPLTFEKIIPYTQAPDASKEREAVQQRHEEYLSDDDTHWVLILPWCLRLSPKCSASLPRNLVNRKVGLKRRCLREA